MTPLIATLLPPATTLTSAAGGSSSSSSTASNISTDAMGRTACDAGQFMVLHTMLAYGAWLQRYARLALRT